MNKNISLKRNTKNTDVYNQENVPELRFSAFSDEWIEFKLKNLAKIQRGASPRPIADKKWYDFDNKNVGWVRIGDVTNSSKFLYKTEDYFSKEGVKKSRFLPKGSLIMSICATIGKPIITDIDTCIHDGFVGFTNLNNTTNEFMYYILKILEKRFISLSQTGTQANLNTDLINNTKVRIPSIDEQRKITQFISAIYKKIDLMETKHKQYTKLKKYLLQNLLPSTETTPKIRFKEFTEEWKTYKLNDLTKINVGFVGSISKYYTSKSEGVPVLSTKNITDRGIELDNINYVTLDFYIKNKKSQLFPQDLIIARHGVSGSAFIVPDKLDKSQALNVIIIRKSKNFISIFMENLFNSVSISRKIHKLKAGSVQGVVNTKEIEKIKVNIPSIEEQEKISSILLNFDKKINLTSENINLLKEFKIGLLQKMFC